MKTGGASAEICWPLRAGIGRLAFVSCISLFIAVSPWGSWNCFVWIRCWWDRNLRLKRWFSSIFGKSWPFYLGWVLMIWRSCLLFKRKDLDIVKIHTILLFYGIKKQEQICFYKTLGDKLSSDTNAGPKIFTLTLIHSKIGNLLQSKTQLHLLFGICSTLKQFEILHSFRIILIIPFPYLTHFWCKCYLLCRCTHLESSSTIVFPLIFWHLILHHKIFSLI